MSNDFLGRVNQKFGTNKEALRFILGLKLRQLRSKKGFSLKDLAKISGLSSSYLNEIEKGKKYPKIEKLLSLAQSLTVPFEELVSLNIGKKLSPILRFLESDLFKELPRNLFGVEDHDLYDLMAQSPEKFSSFLMTLLEIARSYDMKVEQLFLAALRAYLEMNNNYFPELEGEAKKAAKKWGIKQWPVSKEKLQNILESEYSYRIDFTTLKEEDELSELRTVYKKGKSPKLYMNPKLHEYQQAFLFAKELGFQWLKLKKHPIASGPELEFKSFEELLNDFHAAYFAGGLLLDEDNMAQLLKDFFQNSKFDSELFLDVIESQKVPIELFMHRMTQILPEHLKMDKLFFLRFSDLGEASGDRDRFVSTKELHLSQLHNPHGIGLGEHYCRRWITVSLLEEFEGKNIAGAQRSVMHDNEQEYFCISVARKMNLNPSTNSCITIGLLVDDNFKRQVKFAEDPTVVVKEVSQTCERCPISDCRERIAPATIHESLRKKDEKREALEAFVKSGRRERKS